MSMDLIIVKSFYETSYGMKVYDASSRQIFLKIFNFVRRVS